MKKARTKKEMLEFRFLGKKMIEHQLKKLPVKHEEIQRQIDNYIKKFDECVNKMHPKQRKYEIRVYYIELVTIVRTIRYLTENQDTLKLHLDVRKLIDENNK